MERSLEGATFFITADQLGISDEAPGKRLMNNFLHALTQLPVAPEAILLVNSGVKLASKGSDALNDLQSLSDCGCVILSCGMCLDYYGLTDSLSMGKVSNMAEITGILTSASHTITL